MAVAGVLLCGGEGRRLGSDKGAIVLGPTTLAQRAERKLRQSTDFVAVADATAATGGPLAALAAGWAVARAARSRATPTELLDGAVVLAVDMPFVSVALLRWLAAQSGTVVPVVDGRDQPLCARYGAGVLDQASALAAGRDRSMRAILSAGPVKRVTVADWAEVARSEDFFDIDTPADLDTARQRERASAHRPSWRDG